METALPINKILHGDCLEELKKLPDESIDMVITSPPYYGLRNYGVEGQIGLEETFTEFLDKMMLIMAEIKRVVKPTGSIWINFGDCYGGSGMGISYAGQTKGPNSILKDDLSYMPAVGHSRGQFDKCLLLQPERFAIRCIDELGLILRNKIKWAKQVYLKKQGKTVGSVMPTSVKDRFNESGEELYFFVKNKKYFSDLDAVRLPNQVLGVTDMRASGFVRSRELYPESKYNKFGYSPQNKQSNVKRYNEIPPDYGKKKKGVHKQGNRWMSGTPNYTYQGKFAGNPNAEMFNSPRARTQRNKVNDPRGNHGKRLDSIISVATKGLYKPHKQIHELGKNIPTIWQINPEPHNFSKELGLEGLEHFAIFPQALLEIPIKSSCPKNGIILDPFMGSGTTALVAKKLNKNFIGIELNKNYIKIAEARLKTIQNKLL